MILNASNWSSVSEMIAHPNDPTDYSPASVERLMKYLSKHVVHMQNVRPQFRAQNSIQMIDFRSAESRRRYEEAYEKFLQEKAKLEAKESQGLGGMGLQILVQLLKFRQAAEEEKCEDIVDAMYESVQKGEAAVASLNFKYSVSKCVKILNEKYGVSRDEISIIWGGGNTATSAAKKKKLALRDKIANNSKLKELFAECDIDDYDLGIAGVTEAKKVEIDGLRLGAQSLIERQKEIDRFQAGKSLYCFFTLKAGGVGLSLHHSDDLTKDWDRNVEGFPLWEAKMLCLPKNQQPLPGKVRRHKDSGWAVEEDIKFIPVRPRRLFGATTYSAIELVQMLGRCPRLSSLSTTFQTILFYRKTIEERVAYIVSVKLKCLRKVVSQKESWEEVILGGLTKEDGGYHQGEDTILQIQNGGQGEYEDIEQIESELEEVEA